MVTIDQVRQDSAVRTLIEKADAVMDAIGYTEHGMRHALLVSDTAQSVLRGLGHDARRCELAAIAGLLHDVGNVVGRTGHEAAGAMLAGQILREMGMPLDEVCDVMTAVGSHEDPRGLVPALDLCAAVILADKADVHHTRVRANGSIATDIHDRINGSATGSNVVVDPEAGVIRLLVEIDTTMAQPLEYFEIFLTRMALSRKAAKALGCRFEIYINDTRMA